MKIKIDCTELVEELEFHGNKFFTKEQLAEIEKA